MLSSPIPPSTFCCLKYAILPIPLFHHPSDPLFFSFLEHPTPLLSTTRMFHSSHIASSYAIPLSPSPVSRTCCPPLLVPINTKLFGRINQSVDRLLYGDTFYLQLFYLFSWSLLGWVLPKPTQLPNSTTLRKFSCWKTEFLPSPKHFKNFWTHFLCYTHKF